MDSHPCDIPAARRDQHRDAVTEHHRSSQPSGHAGLHLSGQVTSFTDAANDTVSFTYNYGDLKAITDPLSNTIHRSTDDVGRVISITEALGNLTQLAYDNLDHVTQITDANNGLTKFAYDAAENLLSLTDANTNVTAYTYDSRNRAITRKDALSISESYGYDGISNLTSHTDRNGNVINYSYDALNRLSQAQYKIPGGVVQSTVNYTWDAGNRVTKAVDSIAGTINRTYDGLDDLTQEATPQGTVNYTYDNAGRRSTMQVVGQSQATYTFDNANRLTAISQGSAVGFSYDNANRRTCLTLPNGVIATYGYDHDSRVTSITYGTGGSCSSPPSNLGNLTYTYDSAGRRTATAGSLAAVTLPANVSGGSKTAYNADNEQTKFNNTRLSYDSNGNLTGDGTNTYTFDARNHLTAISGGATASFVYDGFGRRMSKTISGTTTQFLYDGLNPVQELNSSNGVVANLLTGLRVDEYFARTDTATSTFVSDALGSTVGLVGSGGTITTSYTYQPFGATTIGGSANGNSYQFTGRENDGTGLYFYRARYYSPTFQRFTAQDPIGFGGGDANLYGYVRNQPLTLLDPFGLYGTQLCDFYSEDCQANGGLSCNLTGICNNWFDKTVGPSWSNCARQCLQELEKDRKPVPNACSEKNQLDLRTDFKEHLFCWPACRLNPNDPFDFFDPYAPNKDIHLY